MFIKIGDHHVFNIDHIIGIFVEQIEDNKKTSLFVTFVMSNDNRFKIEFNKVNSIEDATDELNRILGFLNVKVL
jgi:hypothetical protein